MSNWEAQAIQKDASDPLASFYNRFSHNPNEIYLDGNSLGKLPLGVSDQLQEVITQQWGQNLIRSWNDHWLEATHRIGSKLAQLLGADPEEIIVGESTSVRLFQIAQALVNASLFPNRLLTDSFNFPTDYYIIDRISKQFFNQPAVSISYNDSTICADIALLEEAFQNQPGIYCLSLVTYKSGYTYPIKRLNEIAADNNSIIIWDLSHAVGVIDIDFKETKTKVAIGCTYKYLNGGPGAPAFLFVDRTLLNQLENPIAGWFGHARPFDFSSNFQAATGIQKMAIGTPSILSLVSLEKGLEITLEAGIASIRQKSEEQTQFLLDLLRTKLEPQGVKIESPSEPQQRGSHISISHPEAWRISKALQKGSPAIVPDYRPDHFIRLGIAPLYTRFKDLFDTAERLETIVSTQEYLKYSTEKPQVT